MNVVERYLQAIGRELPSDQRDDILKELRSSLYDALEGAGTGEPSEEQAVQIIKEMGSPRAVAASYYPAGQYVVGPALYPTFVTVLKIVFTALIGVQLVGVIASVSNMESISLADEIGNLLETIPMGIAWVVLVFWGLQRANVQVDPEEAFDPRKLPPVEPTFEPVSRAEQLFSIAFNVVALVLLAQFARAGGFAWVDGTGFFENPVIAQYFPWIVISTVISIVLDIILLWRGRWEASTRIGSIFSNLFSLGVLYVLIQGHNAWLNAEGVSGLFNFLDQIPTLVQTNGQLAGMVSFRFGMSIATIIIAIETVVYVYKLLQSRSRRAVPAGGLVATQR